MKKAVLFVLVISIFILSACENKYDDEIGEVIKSENEELDKDSVETDLNNLERDDTQIWVFDDGEYIKIQYEIRKNDEIDTLYKYDNKKDQYVDYRDGDFHYSDVDDKKPVYTENVNNDS